jgi:hypothetical protein
LLYHIHITLIPPQISNAADPTPAHKDNAKEAQDRNTVSPCSGSDIEDISKWLAPKRHSQDSGKEFVAVPPGKAADICLKNGCQHYATCNNRFIDFPCLRVDPKNWVCSKNKKSSKSGSDSSVSLKMGQREIVPPTHALPAPFWLKNNN